MTSAIDSLQERVDAIRATTDAEVAGRAWHARTKKERSSVNTQCSRAGTP